MDRELPLRLTVVDPPAGVWFRLQKGKRGHGELLPPIESNEAAITFALSLRVGRRPDGTPNFLGPFAQGPPEARFFYVNVGTLAGQEDSCWTRAIKVPLTAITWALIEEALSRPGARLAGSIAGRARDGGPACATVPLLDGGWRPEG